MEKLIPNLLLTLAGLAALAAFTIAGLGGLLGLIDPIPAIVYCIASLGGALYAGSQIADRE